MTGRRILLFKAIIVCGAVFASLAVVEIGGRIASRNWTGSFLEREVNLMHNSYPVADDSQLGWVPRPGFSSKENIWGTQVTIGPDGIRSNGGQTPSSRRGILAVGDSFTFGDEVSDAETWPAQLEPMMNQPVVNGGVFGYGIDQMVIRARLLLEKHQPEWVVLSLIPEDIDRCELTMRGARKPCYRLVDGALHLEQAIVPAPQPMKIDALRTVLGYSWLAHKVLRRLMPGWWFRGTGAEERIHYDGEGVAAALLREFAAELKAANVRFLVVAQADSRLLPEDRKRVARLLAALQADGVRTLDLHPLLADMRAGDEARFKSFFRAHMTADGNRWVAERICEVMQSSSAR